MRPPPIRPHRYCLYRRMLTDIEDNVRATDFSFSAMLSQLHALIIRIFAQATLARLRNRLQPSEADSPQLNNLEAFVEVFAELVCASQEFVRSLHGGERSVCSLRDVARCIRVFTWFGNNFANATIGVASGSSAGSGWTREDFFSVRPAAHAAVRQATVMALSYCYMRCVCRKP